MSWIVKFFLIGLLAISVSDKKVPVFYLYSDYIYKKTEQLAKQYNIPHDYILRVMYKESTYLGRYHKEYNPYKIRYSSKGAVGIMQIMPLTAKNVWKSKESITKIRKRLHIDIDYNLETGVKYIALLYQEHKNWYVVFSVYNQGIKGKTNINYYARFIVNGRAL